MNSSLAGFKQLADAVIITDERHIVLDVNDTYTLLTGYKREEIIGRRAGRLKSGMTSPDTYADMKQALAADRPWSGVFVNVKKDGNLWHSSITITPIYTEEGLFYVGVFRELERIQQGAYLAEARLDALQNALYRVLAASCEIRDPGIEDHLVRVQEVAVQVLERHARRMGLELPERYVQHVKYSSILHDIGKSGIPEGILYKPGALNEYERMIIEHHPRIGADILQKVTLELQDELFLEGYEVARNIILHHHERWDGGGYPNRLSGPDIPLEARIVAVADVFDALTSRRPYKDLWTTEAAIRYIGEQRGKQFDPDIVDSFLDVMADPEPAYCGIPPQESLQASAHL